MLRTSAGTGLRVAAVGALLPLASTAAQEPPTVRDSAGVEIVASSGIDAPLAWSLKRILLLGEALGPPETSFHDLNEYSVAVGPGPVIHVLNRGNARIVTFAPDGEVIGAFGQAGEGPCQMRNPVAIWLPPDGRIHVLDWARGILEFDPEGGACSEETRSMVGFGMHMEEASAGLVHTYAGGMRSDTRWTDQLRVARGQDTLLLTEWAMRPSTRIRHSTCRLTIHYYPVFEPHIAWDTNGSELGVVIGHEYRVDVYGRSGAVTRSVRRQIEPRRVTRDDAIAELGPAPGMTMSGRPCTWDPEELVDERGFYPVVQVIDALALAPDGALWVRRTNPGGDPGPVDVLRPDGSYAGSLPGSTPFPIAFLDGKRFIALETDELEVQYVSVYEIARE